MGVERGGMTICHAVAYWMQSKRECRVSRGITLVAVASWSPIYRRALCQIERFVFAPLPFEVGDCERGRREGVDARVGGGGRMLVRGDDESTVHVCNERG